MSKLPAIPLPHPGSGLEDEYDPAVEAASAEAQFQLAWEDALRWAKRGDYDPIVAYLRYHGPLDSEARDFLADLLAGKIKRPRGKPVKRPEKTFTVDEKGQFCFVDKRDVRRLEIRKWVRDNKPIHGADVYMKAAKQFKIKEESVRDMVRRSSNASRRWRNT